MHAEVNFLTQRTITHVKINIFCSSSFEHMVLYRSASGPVALVYQM
jgi:hypothetical protein